MMDWVLQLCAFLFGELFYPVSCRIQLLAQHIVTFERHKTSSTQASVVKKFEKYIVQLCISCVLFVLVYIISAQLARVSQTLSLWRPVLF